MHGPESNPENAWVKTYRQGLDFITVGNTGSITFENALSGENSVNIYWETSNKTHKLIGSENVSSSSLYDGNITIVGGDGGETISLNDNQNFVSEVYAGNGNDTISADQGVNWIYGYGGDDNIDVGDGNDAVDGGEGNDTLKGGGGSDTLAGGTGSDTFVFLKSDVTSGADTITDFTPQAGDKLDLSSFGISTKSKALDTMTDDGSGNTQVTIDGDLIVTLNGISKSDLSGYDFIA